MHRGRTLVADTEDACPPQPVVRERLVWGGLRLPAMSPTLPEATQSARTFALTSQRRFWRWLLLGFEISMLGVAAWLATWDDSHAVLNGSGFAVIALFLIFVTAPSLFQRIDVQPWCLDYRSLFGRKHIEMRDVTGLNVVFFKGSKILTVRTDCVSVSITDLTVSRRELDDLADFIYAGAEATGNTRPKRPIAQKKFSDFVSPR